MDDRENFKTIHSASAGLVPSSARPASEEALSSRPDQAYLIKQAETIFSCYRKDEVHSPDTYAAAVIAVLSEYPKAVVAYVSDPRTGITGRSKFLPSVAEIREACEEEVARLFQAAERERRIERQLAEREQWQREREAAANGPSYEELKAKHGDGKGGWLGEGGRKAYTEAEKERLIESAKRAGQQLGKLQLSEEAKEIVRASNKAA
jgi:hypothetical protein